MMNEERYQKYIDTQCVDCKNKNKDLCDIRICVFNNIVYTKCGYYERNK